eukprot:scaffold207536_cov51-Attheya_sp.AAC.3
MQSIPCILHCANRVNLKLFTMLLANGLAYAKTGKILSEFKLKGEGSMNFYWVLEESSTIVSILGTVESLSQWKVPTNDAPKLQIEIGIICMVNDKSVMIVDCLEKLIEFCISLTALDSNGLNRFDLWMSCIPHYRSAMKKLRQHEGFTDSDIESFQKDFDLFYQDWNNLHARLFGCRTLVQTVH